MKSSSSSSSLFLGVFSSPGAKSNLRTRFGGRNLYILLEKRKELSHLSLDFSRGIPPSPNNEGERTIKLWVLVFLSAKRGSKRAEGLVLLVLVQQERQFIDTALSPNDSSQGQLIVVIALRIAHSPRDQLIGLAHRLAHRNSSQDSSWSSL